MSGAPHSTTTPTTATPLRRSGAAVACFAFILGLYAGHSLAFVSLPTWLTVTGGAAAAALALSARRATPLLWRWQVGCVIIAMAAAGAAWHDVRLERRPDDSLAVLLPTGAAALVCVEGRVVDEPIVASAQQGRFARFSYQGVATRFTLRVSALVGREHEATPTRRPASGRLWVRVDEAVYQLHAGQRVRLRGAYHPLPEAANPGEPETARPARQFDVVGRLTVSSRNSVERLGDGPDEDAAARSSAGLLESISTARTRFRLNAARWLYAGAFDLDEIEQRRAQSLVSALVLGERSGETQELSAAFRRVGLAHLLSISGLHLAILAAVVALLARCGTSSRRVEMLVVAAVVLAYLFLVPARIPVVRASIMVLGFIAAELAGRRYDRLSVLALIALALLIWRPLELWSPGFQLSFGIVAGLMALGEPFRVRLWGERPSPDTLHARDRVIEAAKTALAGSILAWLLATPLVAYHFRTFCPLAAVAGLAALPLAGGVLVLGYAKILTGALWPSVGHVLGPFLALAAELNAELVVQVDRLPLSSVATPLISWRWAAFATATVVYLVVHRRRSRRVALLLVGVAAVWLAIGSAPPREFRRADDAPLRLDMLSVGDGACTIIRTRGETYLWDCGSANLLSAGERIIVPALRALGVRRLDGVFISHPNLDHYAAALAVVEGVPTQRFFVTPDFFARAREEPFGPVAFLQSELDRRGIAIREVAAGWTMTGGAAVTPVRFAALHPAVDAAYDSINEGSLVLRVEAAGRSILLTGDLEGEGLRWLRTRRPNLRCDVVEIPHHGSAKEETAAWLSSLDPAVVLQSTSALRDPKRAEEFAALIDERTWYVTAQDGAAWVEITREGAVRHGSFRSVRTHGD